jgi:hypothetical protein
MDKDKVVLELELSEMGFMKMELNDFQLKSCPEDRLVALSGKGDDISIYVMGEEKMEKIGLNYKNCVDELPDMKIYHQRVKGDKIEIDSEDNMNLLEKYESFLTRKNMTENKNTSKTRRSVRGLRDY